MLRRVVRLFNAAPWALADRRVECRARHEGRWQRLLEVRLAAEREGDAGLAIGPKSGCGGVILRACPSAP